MRHTRGTWEAQQQRIRTLRSAEVSALNLVVELLSEERAAADHGSLSFLIARISARLLRVWAESRR